MNASELSEREARVHQLALDRAWAGQDHVWRPHVFEGMFAQESVMEGQLSPIGYTQIFWTSLPWFAGAFDKVVPDPYIAVDLNADGYTAATIACPCGDSHEVEIGTIASGDCGRVFAWFGERVLVASSKDWLQETASG